MKPKYLMLLTLALSVCFSVLAAPISKRQAQQQAVKFFEMRGKRVAQNIAPALQKRMWAQHGVEAAYYYVFNADNNQGFVVVSGDDRTDLVLGYADEGAISSDNLPENMQVWLNGYVEQIKWMNEHPNEASAAVAQARVSAHNVKTPIAPLLTCNWNQGAPYNLLCPEYSSGNRSVTGCVATAMAQVMYYHKKPLTTKAAIPGYTTDSYGLHVAALPITSFDWAHMKDNYTSSTNLSDASNLAVAKLMQYAGAVMEMDYGPSSGAVTSWAPERMITYFGFDKDCKWANRNDYDYADWVNLVYDELSRGPVLYSGQSAGGGHAFVCDGYAEGDYFHINWGWGGSSNGYFKLSVLSTSSQGIGGSSTNDGFRFYQGVMYNVHPEDDGVDENQYGPRMTVANLSLVQNDYVRSNSETDFSLGIRISSFNYNLDSYSFDIAVGVYKDGNLLSVHDQFSIISLPYRYGFNDRLTNMSFGAGLPDGEYIIAPVSRVTDSGSEYELDVNADFNYVVATINGNNLHLDLKHDNKISGTLSLASSAFANMPINIQADIECVGSNYSGDVLLYWQIPSGGSYQYARLGGTQVEQMVQGDHQVVDFDISFANAGDYTLVLTNRDGSIIDSKNITVTNGSYPTYVSSTITNLIGGQLYGHKAVFQATFNNTGSVAFNNSINIYLADFTTNYYSGSTSVKVNIPAGQSRTVSFSFDDLVVGHNYQLCFFKMNSSDWSPSFTPNPGVNYYRANGSLETVAPSSSITVPADVLAIDISELSTVSLVTPNSNPNTVYFVNASSVPSGLTGKNVVKNGVATQLNLTDGYSFYTPKAFTATVANYMRSFANQAGQNSGWNTLVLPFTPSTIQANSTPIDWVRNDGDTAKPFWLMEYVADDYENVGFDYATNLTLNTPYLVGVKSELVGQTLQFSASNVTIDVPLTTSVTGDHYLFTGSLEQKTTTGFFMNNTGTAFDASNNGTVQPFRAYFHASNVANTTTTLPLDLGLPAPAPSSPNIVFADANVKAICVANWDTNGDGELSEAEAAAVTDLGTVFRDNTTITSFDELQYFTGLTSIAGGAFFGCSSLTSVIIPENVTILADDAFYCCSGLTSMTMPNSVEGIGSAAFWGCTSMTSLTISNSVTDIVDFVFYGCSALTSLEIPSSVTRIGHGAFAGCSNLSSVTIPNVTSYGDDVFWNSNSLTSVTVGNPTPVDISENVFESRWNATLYVPAGSKEAYQAADYWKEFKNIVVDGSTVQPGDSNGDGEIDVLDATAIMYYFLGRNPDITPAWADINGDGDVDILDATIIMYMAMGIY